MSALIFIAVLLLGAGRASAEEGVSPGLERAIQALIGRQWLDCAIEANTVWKTERRTRAAGILGICEEQLGLFAEAAEHLDHARRHDDGTNPARARAIEEAWERVKKKTAIIHLAVSVDGARLRIDGGPPVSAPLRLYLMPSTITVEVTAPGYAPLTRRLAASAGSFETAHLILSPLAGTAPRRAPMWPLVALGSTGAAGIITAVTLGVIATIKYSEADERNDACAEADCVATAEGIRDEANAYFGGALAAFAAGGGALVGTLMYWAFPPGGMRAAVRVEPVLGPTTGGRLTLTF